MEWKGNTKYENNEIENSFASCNSADGYDLLSKDNFLPSYEACQKSVIRGQNGLFITNLTLFIQWKYDVINFAQLRKIPM